MGRRNKINTEFLSIAKQAVENSGGEPLTYSDAAFIGAMPAEDGADLLGYLIERHQAQKEGKYGQFLLRYSNIKRVA